MYYLKLVGIYKFNDAKFPSVHCILHQLSCSCFSYVNVSCSFRFLFNVVVVDMTVLVGGVVVGWNVFVHVVLLGQLRQARVPPNVQRHTFIIILRILIGILSFSVFCSILSSSQGLPVFYGSSIAVPYNIVVVSFFGFHPTKLFTGHSLIISFIFRYIVLGCRLQ